MFNLHQKQTNFSTIQQHFMPKYIAKHFNTLSHSLATIFPTFQSPSPQRSFDASNNSSPSQTFNIPFEYQIESLVSFLIITSHSFSSSSFSPRLNGAPNYVYELNPNYVIYPSFVVVFRCISPDKVPFTFRCRHKFGEASNAFGINKWLFR
jgi:hypothetical protein